MRATHAWLGAGSWRVLTLCHDRRNLAEYEGHLEIDEQLVNDLLQAVDALMKKVEALAPLA